MGDVLFLAHRLPYPPDRGDRIRSWHVLQALAKLGRVHVCAPFDEENDAALVTIGGLAETLRTRVRRLSKLPAMLRALRSNTPASVEAFRVRALQDDVAQVLRTYTIDKIYAFSSQMAAYVPADFAGRFVMDFVDMDSAKFAELGGLANRQEAKRLLAWEIATARRADVSLFVSRAEAELFTNATGLAADVLGNGIDLDRYAPGAVAAIAAPHPLIVFTGQMDYPPNVEAMTRFVREGLPRIRDSVPSVTLAIVGRAPTAAIRALASDQVIVTGEVPDTRPWLAAADVVVAPLKIARGVQNKVLEAMAMAKPVIVSTGAGQGIDAVEGEALVRADDPVDAVIALLRDPSRAKAMGRAARARMVAHYGWDAQMAPLAGFLGS